MYCGDIVQESDCIDIIQNQVIARNVSKISNNFIYFSKCNINIFK